MNRQGYNVRYGNARARIESVDHAMDLEGLADEAPQKYWTIGRIILSGSEFPILQAAERITRSRPYKQAESPERATEVIREESGGQFDPGLVEAFCALEQRREILNLGSALEHDKIPSFTVLK